MKRQPVLRNEIEMERNPNVLDTLSKHPDPNVRIEVAASSYCGPATYERLARDSDRKVIEMLIRNRRCGRTLLHELAVRWLDDEDMACRIARCYNTSRETLARLARLGTPKVREFVAKHWYASKTLLMSLTKDDSPSVRIAVASRPKPERDVLRMLYKDTNRDVIVALIDSPNAPTYLLNGIIKTNPDAELVRRAEARLDSMSVGGIKSSDLIRHLIDEVQSGSNPQATDAQRQDADDQAVGG